jgi:hypothetical protein
MNLNIVQPPLAASQQQLPMIANCWKILAKNYIPGAACPQSGNSWESKGLFLKRPAPGKLGNDISCVFRAFHTYDHGQTIMRNFPHCIHRLKNMGNHPLFRCLRAYQGNEAIVFHQGVNILFTE